METKKFIPIRYDDVYSIMNVNNIIECYAIEIGDEECYYLSLKNNEESIEITKESYDLLHQELLGIKRNV